MKVQSENTYREPRGKDVLEARFIFVACFVLSLVHVVMRRLWRGRTTNQSLISEAKAAAYSCVSFAFMS